MMANYLFYPGCSMERSARPYLDSLMAIKDALGMQLAEVPDWNCCGATEYPAISVMGAHALVGRNLALAQLQADGSRTLLAGCSACYLNMAKTDYYMRQSPDLASKVNQALAAGGLAYAPGSVEVRHLLDALFTDVGLDAIRKAVVKPLKGLRVACYYGCQVPRPDYDRRFDSHEYPTQLEAIMRVCGATVIDFPMKTHCCGGHMTQISERSAFSMIRRLIAGAAQYDADILVTLCPMCQLNLDAYQVEMNKFFKASFHVPTVFFTQLMGIAFGKDPAALGFGKEFVSAKAALAKIGLDVPESEGQVPAPARPGRGAKHEGLPMPVMPAPKPGEEV